MSKPRPSQQCFPQARPRATPGAEWVKGHWWRSFAIAPHIFARSAGLIAMSLGLSCYPRHTVVPEAGAPQPIDAAVPLVATDAFYGPQEALVTVVAFVDLARAESKVLFGRLDQARRKHAGKLRYVVKQAPSCFHPHSRTAAVASEAVLDLAGPGAQYRFLSDLAALHRLNPRMIARLARDAGVKQEDLPRLTADPYEMAVQADEALARRLQARAGTYFVNGQRYTHHPDDPWVPIKDFEKRITEEHTQARKLYRGHSQQAVYRQRVASNYATASKARLRERTAAPSALNIDLSEAAITGPESAKVTVLHYSELLSGCAAQDADQLEAMRERFGDDLRIAFKHGNFHEEWTAARQAANLAEFARSVGGSALFFQAQTLLLEQGPDLSFGQLEGVARALGLPTQQALEAAEAETFLAPIERGLLESWHYDAFVVNGKQTNRSHLAEAIEVAREQAEAALAGGETLAQLRARQWNTQRKPLAPTPLPPTADRPSDGPADAPFVVHYFVDISAPCAPPEGLDRILVDNPNAVRIVLHVNPKEGELAEKAAAAVLEAHAQIGNPGSMTIAERACKMSVLTEQNLTGWAKNLDLDMDQFEEALKGGRHKSAIAHNRDWAAKLGIDQAQAYVVGGVVAQGRPLSAQLRGAFARLQSEAKPTTELPAPTPAAGPPPEGEARSGASATAKAGAGPAAPEVGQ